MRHEFLFDADGEPRVYWSAQNLTDDQRSIVYHGRAHLWLRRLCLGAEWSMLSRPFFAHAYIETRRDWEDQISVSVAIPGAAVWLSVDWKPLMRILPKLDGKCGISVHDGALWLSIWLDETGWIRADPWWRQPIVFSPMDVLFGGPVYSDRVITETWEPLQLPEGTVMVKVKLYEARWKRPRWPFTTRLMRAAMTPADPIPVPGQWDRDDAVYGLTAPAHTVPVALARLHEHILADRAAEPSWSVPA